MARKKYKTNRTRVMDRAKAIGAKVSIGHDPFRVTIRAPRENHWRNARGPDIIESEDGPGQAELVWKRTWCRLEYDVPQRCGLFCKCWTANQKASES